VGKILEMDPGTGIMHGEAVNVDGAFCVVLSRRRGSVAQALTDRVLRAMRHNGMPVWHDGVTLDAMCRGVADGIEHGHGSLRMPLVRGNVGGYDFAQECGEEELRGAIEELRALHLGDAKTGGVGFNGEVTVAVDVMRKAVEKVAA
jgi:3-dehydroquinate synthase